jgi:hypothetical protein
VLQGAREDVSIGGGKCLVSADFDKLLSALKRVTGDREGEEVQQCGQSGAEATAAENQRQQEAQQHGTQQQTQVPGQDEAMGAALGMGVELEGLSSELRNLLQQLGDGGADDKYSLQALKAPTAAVSKAQAPAQLVSLFCTSICLAGRGGSHVVSLDLCASIHQLFSQPEVNLLHS